MARYVWTVVFCAAAFSCLNPVAVGKGGSNGGGATQIQTISFADQGTGEFEFLTNNTAYLNTTNIKASTTTQSPLSSWEIKVRKAHGQANGGFGLVFNRQSPNNFWYLYIDVNGNYEIGKVVAGTQYYLDAAHPWHTASALITGYGVTNDLKITYNSGTGDYTFAANGSTVITFQDTGMGSVLSGGAMGFLADVLTGENFPDVPVEVYYQVVTGGTTFSASAPGKGLGVLGGAP